MTSFPILSSGALQFPNDLYPDTIREELIASLTPILTKYGTVDPLNSSTSEQEIRACNFNYEDRSATIHFVPKNSIEHSKILHIDILAINFFQCNLLPFLQNWEREGIENTGEVFSIYRENQSFLGVKAALENMPYREELKKIAKIYSLSLATYIASNSNPRLSISFPKLIGLKFFPIPKVLNCPQGNDPLLTPFMIGDTQALSCNKEHLSHKLRTFFEREFPKSTSLRNIQPRIAECFLQCGLQHKNTFQEKFLYIKQVISLLVFKNQLQRILESTRKDLERSVECCTFSYYTALSKEDRSFKLAAIENALNSLCISEMFFLIPLAYRASIAEIKSYNIEEKDKKNFNLGFKPFSPLLMNTYEKNITFSLIFPEEVIIREKTRAKQAYEAFAHLLEHPFGFSKIDLGLDPIPETISTQDREQIKHIQRFLQGISSLAISGGSSGRLAVANYYAESRPKLCENLPYEYILTVAQYSSNSETNWMEEGYLGYLHEILGELNPLELSFFTSHIKRMQNFIRQIPVEEFMVETENNFELKKNPWEKICYFYEKGCETLQPFVFFSSNLNFCSIL